MPHNCIRFDEPVRDARDAMPDGGMLCILAENYLIDEKHKRRLTEAKVGSYVAIAVSDTGIGIPERYLIEFLNHSSRQRIWQRYRTWSFNSSYNCKKPRRIHKCV